MQQTADLLYKLAARCGESWACRSAVYRCTTPAYDVRKLSIIVGPRLYLGIPDIGGFNVINTLAFGSLCWQIQFPKITREKNDTSPHTHTHSLRLNEWSPILSSRMPDCTPCLSHWGGKERWSHVLTSAIRSSRWTGWRFVIWEVGQGLHPTLYSYFMFLRNVCFLLLPTCVENNQAQLQYIDIYFNWLAMFFLKPIWNTFCSCTFFLFFFAFKCCREMTDFGAMSATAHFSFFPFSLFASSTSQIP